MLPRALIDGAPSFPRGVTVLVLEGLLAFVAGMYLVLQGGVPAGLALLVFAVAAAPSVVSIAASAAEARMAFAFLPTVLALNLLGLVVLAVIAPSFAWRQCLWSLLGLATYLSIAVHVRSLAWLRRWAVWLCLASLALLGATFAFGTHPLGPGAKQWLPLGPVYFQPSEAVKVTVVLLLAVTLGEQRDGAHWPTWWLALPTVAILLLLAQGDLGAAVVVAMAVGLLLVGARGQGKWPLALLIAVAIASYGACRYVPRARERLSIWLDIWQDPYGASYQIVQSLRAIASAGVAGKGLFPANSVFVPASHTDMTLAAIGERLGLAGSLLVPLLFLSLLARTRAVARATSSSTDALICLGGAALLVGQAFIIMAGSTAMVPLTGVTLPFVSYGGSSLLVSYALLGVMESRRRYPGSPGGTSSLRPWQQAIYLALAAGMMVVGIWLTVWHVYGTSILAAQLPGS